MTAVAKTAKTAALFIRESKDVLLAELSRPVCIVPRCNRKEHCRGLCNSHRNYLCQLVKDGVLTKEEAERKLLPPKRGYAKAFFTREEN